MDTFKIVEFKPEYQSGVIDVIGKNLAVLKVVPTDSLPIDDEDLFHIPKVYSGRGRFWVALQDGKVIGTVAIRDMGGATAKLNRMFVTMDLHGKGIGQKLFDHAKNFAKKQGFAELILNTHFNMERAHHFYEKNGFIKTGSGEDKYFYRLEL